MKSIASKGCFASFAGVVSLVAPSLAQEAHVHSPCAGQQSREIKSLSEEEVSAYRRGEGMGFALLGELNHYPGPKHALELADSLGLDQATIAKVRAVFETMQAEAIRLGNLYIANEAAFDRSFAERAIDPEGVRERARQSALVLAELRATHLNAHLVVRDLLGEDAVARYDQLRGYHDGGHPVPRGVRP